MKQVGDKLALTKFDPLIERLPFTEKRTVSLSIASLLKNDLYLSFVVSSGDQSLHDLLFPGMASYYRGALGYPSFDWSSKQHDALMGMFRGMQMPRSHKKVPQYAPDNFGWMGGALLAACKSNSPARFDTSDVERLTERFIQVDTSYSSGEKRRFYGKRDPHESYFRTYVLLQQSTGSEAIDHTVGAVREHVLGQIACGDSNNNLGLLAEAWQTTHEGEIFFPARAVD